MGFILAHSYPCRAAFQWQQRRELLAWSWTPPIRFYHGLKVDHTSAARKIFEKCLWISVRGFPQLDFTTNSLPTSQDKIVSHLHRHHIGTDIAPAPASMFMHCVGMGLEEEGDGCDVGCVTRWRELPVWRAT
jgi:hypothetical protein